MSTGDVIAQPSGKNRAKDRGFLIGLLLCVGVSILLLGVLLFDIVVDGAGNLTWEFITSFSSINADQSGIQAAFWGTIWLMGVCALFVIPVGVATAIYLEEYADETRWYNRFVELNIQNLAAVPSIVYGILGLAFLVRGPLSLGPVVLAGGLTLGLLVLPVVIVASREAIRAVPPSIREGSMALGATQWQTIWKQVLPASIPGIATGVILASGPGHRRDGPPDRDRRRHLHRLQPGGPRLPVHRDADPDLRLDHEALQRRQRLLSPWPRRESCCS